MSESAEVIDLAKVRRKARIPEESGFIERIMRTARRPDGGLLLVWEQEHYPQFAVSFLMLRYVFRIAFWVYGFHDELNEEIDLHPTFQLREGNVPDAEFVRRHIRDTTLMRVSLENVIPAFSSGVHGPYTLYHRNGVAGGRMSPLLRKRLLEFGSRAVIQDHPKATQFFRSALLTTTAEIGAG